MANGLNFKYDVQRLLNLLLRGWHTMSKMNYEIDFMIELETHYSEAEYAFDDVIAELKNGKDILEIL